MLKKSLLIVFCLCLASITSAEILVLENGKTLKVKSYDVQGPSMHIQLSDRGEMVIPVNWVTEIRPSPPEPAPQAAAVNKTVDEKLQLADVSEMNLNFAYADIVYPLSIRHKVDWRLIAAIMKAESNYNPRAISPKGARGLMQLMPATAGLYDVSLKQIHDPEKNIEAGVRHLKKLIHRYNGKLDLVAAAYNAGEGAVDRFGGIPPYSETRAYVKKVLEFYQSNQI